MSAWRPRGALVVACAAACAAGLFAEYAGGPSDPWVRLPDLLVGWSFCLCGLLALDRPQGRRTAVLLLATGVAWFLPNLASALSGPAAAVLAQLLYLPLALLVHLLITFPTGSAGSWPARLAILVGYASALLLLWGHDGFVVALAAALITLAMLDLRRLRGRMRRARLVGTAALVAVVGVAGVAALTRLVLGEAAAPAGRWVMQLVLTGTAVAVLVALRSAWWDRATVTDLVVELGAAPSDRLRDGLARALADPSLQVGYWLAEPPGWVDARGRAFVPREEPGRARTRIDGSDGPLAVLTHDPAVLGDPVLLSGVRVAASLSAANARLTAQLRAAVRDLDASRRRLLDAADEERRRLENRLREGAERRLEGIAVTLSELCMAPLDQETTARVQVAEAELRETLIDLERLARGLHPRELDELGLGGALRILADRSPVPVELDLAPLGPEVDPALLVAAYYLCAEALANCTKHAEADRIRIDVRTASGRLLIEATDDGVGGAERLGSGLRGLADRIDVLGGSFLVVSPPAGGTRLSADMPLRPPPVSGAGVDGV